MRIARCIVGDRDRACQRAYRRGFETNADGATGPGIDGRGAIVGLAECPMVTFVDKLLVPFSGERVRKWSL